MTTIEEIKMKLNCVKIAQMIGLNISRPGDRCKSFREGAGNATSLLINENSYHDFGSGEHGDSLQLYANAKDISIGSAIAELSRFLGIRQKKEFSVKFHSMQKLMNEVTTFYNKELLNNPKALTYLAERKINIEIIKELKLGWANNPYDYLKSKGFSAKMVSESGVDSFLERIMIPYIKNNNTMYFVGRSEATPRYKKLKRSDYNDNIIYELIKPKSKEIYITEGNFDAITVYQEGYSTVSPTSGKFSHSQKKYLYDLLRNKIVTIVLDYDSNSKTGQRNTMELAEELFLQGIDAKVVLLEDYIDDKTQSTDISDLYNKDKKNIQIIEKGEEYSKKIFKTIETLNELQEFIINYSRFFDAPNCALLMSYMINKKNNIHNHDVNFIKACFVEGKKPPSEEWLVRELAKKTECIFIDGLGWYEYRNGFWNEINVYEFRQKIAKLLGKYLKANLMKNIECLAEQEMLYVGEINKDEYLNLTNGMLDVNTRTLYPHAKEYYSTIRIPHTYKKNMISEKWLKAIGTILNNDKRKIDCLQEIFGYCLTKNTMLQKAFFFTGEGSNGKSFIINTLIKMLSKENVSSLELQDFDSRTERIKIANKLLNTATELKATKLTDMTEFKKIVTGDAITANYKYLNSIDFNPFCKLVFAMNEFPRINDLTHGFNRRIHFINFDVKFVDNPRDNSNERKAIKDFAMSDQDYTGILNWALDGLERIKNTKKLTETAENTNLKKRIKIKGNITIEFLQEWLEERHYFNSAKKDLLVQVTYKNFYNSYKDFCEENNYNRMSKHNFNRDVELILDSRMNRIKIRGDRGLEFRAITLMNLITVNSTQERKDL